MEGINYLCQNGPINNVDLTPLVDKMNFLNNFMLIDPIKKYYFYQLDRIGFPQIYLKELKSYCSTYQPENQNMDSLILCFEPFNVWNFFLLLELFSGLELF